MSCSICVRESWNYNQICACKPIHDAFGFFNVFVILFRKTLQTVSKIHVFANFADFVGNLQEHITAGNAKSEIRICLVPYVWLPIDRCVFRMDHHCAWIDNCVGIANQKFFILFLIYSGASNLMCQYFHFLRQLSSVDTSFSFYFSASFFGLPKHALQ